MIGCGSIGERHVRNLLGLKQEVFIFDRDLKRMDYLAGKYKVQAYDFLSHHIKMDGWIICVPPVYHLMFAEEGLKHNAHLFIEKPISHTLEGVDRILAEAESKGLIVQVGYQFRFNSSLRIAKNSMSNIGKIMFIRSEFGQSLPDWHPSEDYRDLYTSRSDLGGGIILDASHEIDYVSWLAQSEVESVFCIAGKLGNLEIDVEDTAEMILTFRSGIIASIHVDMTQRDYTRTCKIVGQEGTILWDYKDGAVRSFDARKKCFGTFRDAMMDKSMYEEEMKDFVNCVETGRKPLVDGFTGKKVLQVCLAAKESAKSGKVIKLEER